jgi:peptide/nickel transport system substrate-binding protein
MRSGSKRLGSLVALAAVSVLLVAACTKKGSESGDKGPTKQFSPGFAECETKPDDCNSGQTKKGGTIVVALGKVIPNLNIWASDGNLVESVEVMNGVTMSPFIFLPSGKIVPTDLVAEEPKVTSTSPQTVVYKINPKAVWEDNSPVTADDFDVTWRMLNGHDEKINIADSTGYKSIESVKGSDNGKTVTVTFKSGESYPDYKGLFSLIPAHIIAKSGDIKTDAALEAGFKALYTDTSWTVGPYKISNWTKEKQVELVPNPKWYGKTQPVLDKIVFQFVVDSAQLIPALQNKEIGAFVIQPNRDIVTKLQGMTQSGVGFEMTAGYSYEHFDLNAGNKFLADVALRQAIFTAINTQELMDKTIKTFFSSVKPMGSHMLYPVQQGYVDNRAKVAPDQGSGDADKAKKILTDAGYKLDGGKLTTPKGEAVPSLRFRFTKGNVARAQLAEIFQSQMKKINIDIKIDPTDDLSGTLDAKDYDVIVFGWAGSALLTGNRGIFHSKGENNKTNFGDPKADDLLDQAIKELDEKKAIDLYNQADEILYKDAITLPLWPKPNLLAANSDYRNIRDNNAGSYHSYNTQEWGIKAS